jgi:hypothetical protein
MRGMFAAPVWHYWLGAVLAIAAVVTVVALVAAYLKKVESTRYPKGE